MKHFNSSKTFTEYSKILKNIKEKNPDKKRKIFIVLHGMITDMLTNKKAINQIVTNLFIRNRKLNIPLVFITQFYFTLPKNSRLNYKNYFNIKIPQK